jgi:hypothetical protein
VLYAHSRTQPEVIEPVLPYGRRKITLASVAAGEGSQAGQSSLGDEFDEAEDVVEDAEVAV